VIPAQTFIDVWVVVGIIALIICIPAAVWLIVSDRRRVGRNR
jgi:hypothetical protein